MRHVRWHVLGLAALLVGLLTVPSLGASNPENLRWTQFTMVDGLPSNTVWAIAPAPGSSDIWLGTSHGAALYRDGRWYGYTRAQGLGNDWVSALAVDGGGRVWFGTFGGGLTLLDGENWQTYTAANSGLAGDWVSALTVAGEGRLWCGTWGAGLSLLDHGRWQTYSTANSPLPADYITALAAAPDGTLWVALHGQGLARLADDRWTLFGAAQGLADDFVNALALGPDGSLWAGTSKGLSHLAADGQVLKTYTAANGLPDDRVQALAAAPDGRLWVGTAAGAALLEGERWTVYRGQSASSPASSAGLAHDYVSAIAVTPGGVWFGSVSSGVARYGSGTVAATRRLPVVLVHGWHGPDSDRLEDSEFRFLASWLHDDGYPVYYATGVSPKNTLHQNAAAIRAAVEKAKKETGAAQVDIIAYSMGGLNTRAYIESSLYAGDVDQAFILGTPEVGVRTWYPFLLREIHEWSRDPSAVELTPEYATLFNSLHTDGAGVPYTLIAGDARGEGLPDMLRGLPAGDALISAGSALALSGPQVHKVLTDDLHAWSDQTILLGLPSYLWPRTTYDAYIRNRLRLGAGLRLPGVQQKEADPPPPPEVPSHSPFYSGQVAPGKTVTQTVTVDSTGEVRFYLRGETGPLTFSLIDPQGHTLDAKTIADQGEFFDLGLANFQGYLVRQPQPGRWQVVVGRPEDAQGAARFTGYATFDSPLRLTAAAGKVWFGQGEEVPVTATLRDGATPLPGATVEAEIGRPDGQVERLTLLDDGAHGDGAAGDGVYGATYRPPNLGGYYTLFATAQGEQGAAYARTAETLFAVSPATARLTGEYAATSQDTDRDGRYEALTVQVGIDARAAGSYLVAATLQDAQGREVGRVAEPVTLNAGRQTVTLRFPGSLFLGAQVDGPYAVARVTLLDEAGAAIPLQEATNVLQTPPYRFQDFEGP